MMKTKLSIFAILAAGAMTLSAQESHLPVTLGFKVGIPVTETFNTSSNSSILSGTSLTNGGLPGSNYSSATPRYEFGLSGEFHLIKHFSLEVDGLYKRAGFASSAPFNTLGNLAYENTNLNVWEFPALIKTNIKLGRFQPFVDVGASLRHISTVRQTSLFPGLSNSIISDNSNALHNRNSFGGVAGFGITFKKGPFKISPEARYTRWANQSFTAPGLRTNLDQGDILLGVTF
jgi:hypothetical protein